MTATFVPAISGFVAPTAAASPRSEALGIWARWNRGVSVHTTSARAADLASFGTFAWRCSKPEAVIRRVLQLARETPRTLRELAVRWIEHGRDRELAIATLQRRWQSLHALERVLVAHDHTARVRFGPFPRLVARRVSLRDAHALIASLVARGRPRDAVLVALFVELGMTPPQVRALLVRDAMALALRPEIRAALELACAGARPQDAALRGPQGRALSLRTIYTTCEGLGTTVTALRRLVSEG